MPHQCLRCCIQAVACGYVRKMSLLFIFLSLCGYLIFVAGFGVLAHGLELSSQAARFLLLPYWGAVIFGPITYVLSVVHMALSGRYTRLGQLFESLTTFSYFAYTITISSPFVVSALFIFGASGFGNFENFVEDMIPLPSIREILGIENEFLDTVAGLVEVVYNLLQDGAQLVVDLVLALPSGDEFTGAIRSQFSGCCITILFMACSIALWPFYSRKKDS